MSMKALLDNWRNYFRGANGDIFDIIDHAIMVAALDCPKEFKLRRDRIAEKMFTCKLDRCSGCDRVELRVPAGNEFDEGEEDVIGCKRDGCEFEAGGSKESKVNSSRDEHVNNIVSNFSYGEAEALTDEMEEESLLLGEVLRIKQILEDSQDESDSVLFESLRRLQLMGLTVDTLKVTEIGKAVNLLRKHGSKEIQHLARTLITEWKVLVDEWVNTTKGFTEGTPDSVNPSVVDEKEDKELEEEEEEEEDYGEGLPSPPLDELAFFAAPTSGIELSQFFDGMDEDGNPQNCGEFIKNRENSRKPTAANPNIPKQKQQTTPNVANLLGKDNKKNQPLKRQEAAVKPNKSSNADSGPRRPPKQNTGQKLNGESRLQPKLDKPKRSLNVQQDKLKRPDEDKLEATKRKLQESYQQVEKAKRQRTIQVMELHDLPKQGLGHRNPHVRPGNHNRHWANGRR